MSARLRFIKEMLTPIPDTCNPKSTCQVAPLEKLRGLKIICRMVLAGSTSRIHSASFERIPKKTPNLGHPHDECRIKLGVFVFITPRVTDNPCAADHVVGAVVGMPVHPQPWPPGFNN